MRLLMLPLLLSLCPLPAAAATVLRVALSESSSMPLQQLEHGVVVRGILKDLGEALAQQLQREVVWRALPRKRLERALTIGDADILCYSRPEWLSAQVYWSRPILRNSDIVVTRGDIAKPRSLAQLADRRLGTITGFLYPPVEDTLGAHFARDDSHDELSNIRKLQARRVDYVLTNEIGYLYQRRHNPALIGLNPQYLRYSQYEALCALSRRSTVSLPQLDAAILQLEKSGRLAAILAAYR